MKEKIIIEPGEYHTTDNSRIVYTLLGSCVAVCLKDESAGIAGMNHFMLPQPINRDAVFTSDSGRYGIHAIELLINEMLLRGAARDKLWAKVFGGAHVLDSVESSRIPDSNVEIAFVFLETEGIPIIAKDIGGIRGRKIAFRTGTGKVKVEKIQKTEPSGLKATETSYKKRIVWNGKSEGFTLFERRRRHD